MNFIMKTHFPCIFTFLFGVSALQAQTITNFVPKNGKEGTTITITGTGFTGNVEVAFGNSAFVDATVNSDTELTAQVPADATAGKVKVQAGGTEVASEDDFRYVSVTGFSPMEAGVGEKVTFTGTGFATYYPDGITFHFQVFFGPPNFNTCQRVAGKISDDGTSAELIIPACAKSGNLSVEVNPNDGETAPDYKTYIFELPGFVLAAQPDIIINSFSPAVATAGQVVTITGTGFAADGRDLEKNKVTFGGTDDIAEAISSKTKDGVQALKVYVPANAESGKISVEVLSKAGESPADIEILEHAVDDFSPRAFRPDHEITITGTNFAQDIPPLVMGGRPTHYNEVCFDNICLDHEKIDVNDKGTKLTLKAPNNIPEGTGALKVRIGDREVTASGNYTSRPNVAFTFTGFMPASARMGETVTLTGTGFSQKGNQVALSNTTFYTTPTDSKVYEVNEDQTQIKVRISPNVRGRESSIEYVVARNNPNRLPISLEGFSVPETPPLTITSFSPISAIPGQEITITGTGFSLYAPHAQVRFGGNEAAFSPRAHEVNADGTELKVRLHIKAQNGKITVFYLNIAFREEHRAVSGEDFTVIRDNPVITSFSPASGEPGDEIAINGSNFSPHAPYNEVSFAHGLGNVKYVTADWVNEDGTQLRATIGKSPFATLNDGTTVTVPRPIGVRVGTVFGESTDKFELNESAAKPVVSSFSPTEGGPGTEVAITGENFSDNPAENTVAFDGVATTPSASTTTLITVKVPVGTRTGRISVTVDGQTGVSETDFTVSGTEPVPPPRPSDILSVPGAEGVHVYPNPASQEVRLTNLPAAAHTYRVYSLAGKVVLTGAARGRAAIDVSGLARGQYVLVLQAEDGSETLRTRLLLLK